ncbi:unnamed protein product [Sphagnum balticum]
MRGELLTRVGCRSLLSLGSGQCHRDLRRGAGGGGGEQPAMTATGCFFSAEHQHNLLHKSGQEDVVENLWRKFFSDPLQWWDNRSEKGNQKYPDFTHKKTQEALWLDGNLNPAWVTAKVAALPPGTVQSSVFSWNTKLARYVKAGQYKKAMELFQQMQQEGVTPDRITFIRVLNACAGLQALEEGRHIHAQIKQSGFESNVYVGSSLVDMYVKCGSMEDAWREFNRMPTRDVFAWKTIIRGHIRCGQQQRVLALSQQMQQEGVEPDPFIFVVLLNACASSVPAALEEGRRVHEHVIQSGCESNIYIGTSLIDMYAKCGSIEDAWRVFSRMPTHNAVSWTAMILGYVKCGHGQKALALFQQMQHEGIEATPVTFVGVLNACASLVALDEGRCVHEQIIQSGCEADAFVGSSLIDMYAKCGSIEDAWAVFNRMPTHDVVSWTSMLGGYAMYGCGREALEHFEQMCQAGIEVNKVTFIHLLSACSHVGLLDEGLHLFESMGLVYSISPIVDHYSCMVDLLGRSGHLHKAEDFIKTMPCEPDAAVWKALFNACRVHGNMEMGECAAKKVVKLHPDNAASYLLLSTIYAAAGKWDLKANVQWQRMQRDIRDKDEFR